MKNIKEVRCLADVTQTELARRSGLARSTIVNYETGRRIPRVDDLERIANALEVDICDFFIRHSHQMHRKTSVREVTL
jgi:transcriptional regulator with XRE-family HTH domain